MTPDLSTLDNATKLLFAIELQPVQGERFQPTGFPSLGAATYETKTGTSLLVESPQSMANRLETTSWDEAKQTPKAILDGISYVRVERNGKYLTSSIEEAHRLNSVYIERSYLKGGQESLHAKIKAESNYDDSQPVDRKAFLRTVFKYDVNSLLHGVFLESIGGRLRIARALSAFIEAEHVHQAVSGGVKNDNVQPGKEETRNASGGFGNVPFPREEFTANKITLFVNLDLAQIRGYGLGSDGERLLILLALFKLRVLLDGELRLRTACDFIGTTDTIVATRPPGFTLPSIAEIIKELTPALEKCRAEMVVSTVITTALDEEPAKPKKAKEGASGAPDSDADGSGDDDAAQS